MKNQLACSHRKLNQMNVANPYVALQGLNSGNSTHTRSEKPRTCKTEIGQTRHSHPRKSETSQILRVRHVSVRLRAVAETCRVTLSPKKLKSDMLIAIAMPDQSTVGVSIIWCHPRGRSKNDERSENCARTGIKIKIVSAPKRPS